MTAKEKAAARDAVARAKLAEAKPKPKPAKKETPREIAGRIALAALREAEERNTKRMRRLYPVRSVLPVVECPVHLIAVAVDKDGRLASTCPRCVKEAADAVEVLS